MRGTVLLGGLGALVLPFPGAALPAGAAEPDRAKILGAMQAELARTRAQLALPGHEPPYFVAYTLKDVETAQVAAAWGALVRSERWRGRYLGGDVRVGSHEFDSSKGTGHDVGDDFFGSGRDRSLAPLDDDPEALRAQLWSLSDEMYKDAVTVFFRKKARAAEKVEEKDRPADHSRETPQRFDGPRVPFAPPVARMESLARRLSAEYKRHAFLLDGNVEFEARRVRRYTVNSEGSRVASESAHYALRANVRARADDGMLVTNFRSFYGRTPEELPPEAEAAASVRGMVDELATLAKAPAMDPYTGPALLENEVSAVLFHEVLGHRLEGERQREEREGQTFKGKVGEPVLPAFLSVADDPTLATWRGKPLIGHYDFDDECVPAQRAALIESGKLVGYLLSRTPIKGFEKSNGHGRGAIWEDPIARMANLIVTAADPLPASKLRERLLDEARRQGKPYGLVFRHMRSGETNTTKVGFQAFRGTPILVSRVWATDGREELVRGVEIVGTPLVTLTKIVAAGDDPGVFNGYCGAESGFLPVANVAPSVLISELEVQRVRAEPRRPPLLPRPIPSDPLIISN